MLFADTLKGKVTFEGLTDQEIDQVSGGGHNEPPGGWTTLSTEYDHTFNPDGSYNIDNATTSWDD